MKNIFKKTLACFLISYTFFWFLSPVPAYRELNRLIKEFNEHTQLPYRIEHDGIFVKKNPFESPLKCTFIIKGVRLVFKTKEKTIVSDGPMELTTWFLHTNQQNCVSDYFNS